MSEIYQLFYFNHEVVVINYIYFFSHFQIYLIVRYVNNVSVFLSIITVTHYSFS